MATPASRSTSSCRTADGHNGSRNDSADSSCLAHGGADDSRHSIARPLSVLTLCLLLSSVCWPRCTAGADWCGWSRQLGLVGERGASKAGNATAGRALWSEGRAGDHDTREGTGSHTTSCSRDLIAPSLSPHTQNDPPLGSSRIFSPLSHENDHTTKPSRERVNTPTCSSDASSSLSTRRPILSSPSLPRSNSLRQLF
jgi:hypothetical protein